MRILHTADWHIGQLLYGYDRGDEHADMIAQIADIAHTNSVDALLVCGDLFDNGRPSAQSMRIFANGMARIHELCPDLVVVVIAGNHDSGALLESHADIYRQLNIHLIGNIDRNDPMAHIVRIDGKGVVAALPYVYSRNMPESFASDIVDVAVSLAGDQALPVILAAHTTVLGADSTGHALSADGRFDIGNIEGVEASVFGDGYDYLALGHIHRPQFIGSGNRIRYSGSPVAVSFDERFEHGVSLVEIGAHGDVPEITFFPLRSSRPLITIPSRGFGEWNDVIAAYRALDPDLDAYIRLNVVVDAYLPAGARDEAERVSATKSSRFCLINSCRRESDEAQASRSELTVSEFRTMPVIDIARMYASETGVVIDEQLLSEVIDKIKSDRQ